MAGKNKGEWDAWKRKWAPSDLALPFPSVTRAPSGCFPFPALDQSAFSSPPPSGTRLPSVRVEFNLLGPTATLSENLISVKNIFELSSKDLMSKIRNSGIQEFRNPRNGELAQLLHS